MPAVHTTVLPSFGRRRGRRLRTHQSELIETLLPRLLIALPEGPLHLGDLFEKSTQPLWFEIGFGGGEHLVEQARRHPEINFIGCEPYINGMASLLSSIEKNKLANIRLYDDDARMVLEKLPDASIERLFVLFPDPWPKARHHKRRIVSEATLTLLYQKLIKGGLLRLATDHEDYATWMFEKLFVSEKFTWQAEHKSDWQKAPSDWVRTRYQEKAEKEGRKAIFINMIK